MQHTEHTAQREKRRLSLCLEAGFRTTQHSLLCRWPRRPRAGSVECTLGTNSSLSLLNLFPEKPFAVIVLAVGLKVSVKLRREDGYVIGWVKAFRGHLVVHWNP
eukprot:s1312_g3.t1